MQEAIRQNIRKDHNIPEPIKRLSYRTNLSDSDVYEGGNKSSPDDDAIKPKRVTKRKKKVGDFNILY